MNNNQRRVFVRSLLLIATLLCLVNVVFWATGGTPNVAHAEPTKQLATFTPIPRQHEIEATTVRMQATVAAVNANNIDTAARTTTTVVGGGLLAYLLREGSNYLGIIAVAAMFLALVIVAAIKPHIARVMKYLCIFGSTCGVLIYLMTSNGVEGLRLIVFLLLGVVFLLGLLFSKLAARGGHLGGSFGPGKNFGVGFNGQQSVGPGGQYEQLPQNTGEREVRK